jgi:hypothetical protein
MRNLIYGSAYLSFFIAIASCKSVNSRSTPKIDADESSPRIELVATCLIGDQKSKESLSIRESRLSTAHCAEGETIALQNTTADLRCSKGEKGTWTVEKVSDGKVIHQSDFNCLSAVVVARRGFVCLDRPTRNTSDPSFPYIISPKSIANGIWIGESDEKLQELNKIIPIAELDRWCKYTLMEHSQPNEVCWILNSSKSPDGFEWFNFDTKNRSSGKSNECFKR